MLKKQHDFVMEEIGKNTKLVTKIKKKNTYVVTITRPRVQYNKYFTGFTLRNFLYNNQIRGMSKMCTRIVCNDLNVTHLLLSINVYYFIFKSSLLHQNL